MKFSLHLANIALVTLLLAACTKNENLLPHPEIADSHDDRAAADRDLYCFDWSVWHKAESNNDVMHARGIDGNPINWQNMGPGGQFIGETDRAPDLANFNGTSFLFYLGDDTHRVFFSRSEPNPPFPCAFGWEGNISVPGFPGGISATSGPTAVVFNGKLYVFVVSSGHVFFNRTSDGVNWEFEPFEIIPGSVIKSYIDEREVAAAVLNGRLYIFFVYGDMIRYTSTPNGFDWAPVDEAGESTKEGISAVTAGEEIVLVFTGASSKRVLDMRCTVDNSPFLAFSEPVHVGGNAFSNKKPDIAIAKSGKLVIAHKGRNSNKIYHSVAASSSSPWSSSMVIQDASGGSFPETTQGVGLLSTF
jgi:hypothetical protein